MAVLAIIASSLGPTIAHGQTLRDHLKCFKVKDSRPKAKYTADMNGLIADTGCVIKVPAALLCVDSSKTNVQPTPPDVSSGEPPTEVACYKAKCPKAVPPTVAWHDQFGTGVLTPSRSTLLCAPRSFTQSSCAPSVCPTVNPCTEGAACASSAGQCFVMPNAAAICTKANSGHCQADCDTAGCPAGYVCVTDACLCPGSKACAVPCTPP
jgi:hypothetical protein